MLALALAGGSSGLWCQQHSMEPANSHSTVVVVAAAASSTRVVRTGLIR